MSALAIGFTLNLNAVGLFRGLTGLPVRLVGLIGLVGLGLLGFSFNREVNGSSIFAYSTTFTTLVYSFGDSSYRGRDDICNGIVGRRKGL